MADDTVKIYVDNVYVKLENVDRDTELVIWNTLSFQIEEYGTEYIHHRRLYNRKTKKTYAGLLPYVLQILEERDWPYEVIDGRFRDAPNANFAILDGFTARPYQQEIIDRVESREVIQCATGGGKTFMMAGITAKFNVMPVLIFADKIGLCQQIKDEFQRFLGVEIGIIGDGVRDIKDITVCSIQSVVDDKELLESARLILIDECLSYDSLVLMENGTYENIGKLVDEQSDKKVLSYNHRTGEIEPKSIISHSKTPLSSNGKKMMRIKVRKADGTLETIECTDNHKIWVESLGQYVMARDLAKGQTLKAMENLTLSEGLVEDIEYIEMSNEKYTQTYVYDIGVEDNHNFFTQNTLVHNCHHTPASSFMAVIRGCVNAYYRVGVSATPWRDGGDDLLIEAGLSKRKPENNINASFLIKRGFLVPATIYMVPHKQSFQGKNYNKLYTQAIVENQARNEDIVEIATRMHEVQNRTTLILIQRVEHGNKLLEMLTDRLGCETFSMNVEDPKTGRPTIVRVKSIEFLSGKDGALRRKAVIQAVREKRCKLLIGSTIADEGLDVPSIDALVLCGGGKSSTRAFQRIGRALRLYTNPSTGEEKKRAIVFDFIDETPMLKRHANIRRRLYQTEDEWEIKMFNPNLLR